MLKDRINSILLDCNRLVKGKYVVFHSDEALERIIKEIEKGPKLLMNIDNVRLVVDWYAKRMEKRLRERDVTKGKDGWHNGNLYYYLSRVAKCVKAILKIIKITIIGEIVIPKRNRELKEKEIHLAIKKCIDGGNYFMMLADNLRDILLERGIKK